MAGRASISAVERALAVLTETGIVYTALWVGALSYQSRKHADVGLGHLCYRRSGLHVHIQID